MYKILFQLHEIHSINIQLLREKYSKCTAVSIYDLIKIECMKIFSEAFRLLIKIEKMVLQIDDLNQIDSRMLYLTNSMFVWWQQPN